MNRIERKIFVSRAFDYQGIKFWVVFNEEGNRIFRGSRTKREAWDSYASIFPAVNAEFYTMVLRGGILRPSELDMELDRRKEAAQQRQDKLKEMKMRERIHQERMQTPLLAGHRTNADRRADALAALTVHVKATCGSWDAELEGDPKSCLADLVTNLMHLAKELGVEWRDVVGTATMNYDAEAGPCERCHYKDHGEEECDRQATL